MCETFSVFLLQHCNYGIKANLLDNVALKGTLSLRYKTYLLVNNTLQNLENYGIKLTLMLSQDNRYSGHCNYGIKLTYWTMV